MRYMYVAYDPSRHKDVPICAVEDGPGVDGTVPTLLREVTDPEEH